MGTASVAWNYHPWQTLSLQITTPLQCTMHQRDVVFLNWRSSVLRTKLSRKHLQRFAAISFFPKDFFIYSFDFFNLWGFLRRMNRFSRETIRISRLDFLSIVY